MLFDSLILASVTDELERTVVGGKVEKITQPSPPEIILRIYHIGKTHHLLFSCDPMLARVHLTQIRRENPPSPPTFCSLLRKYLDGAWVEGAALPLGLGERVLQVEFRAVDGAAYSLIAETMGRMSNLVLVNSAGTILGAAKLIGRDVNRFRQIFPGLPYAAPPRQRGEAAEPKRDPLANYDPPDNTAMTPAAARSWLMATFMGISPLLAQEVVLRTGGELTAQALWSALSNLLSVVKTREWSPRVWSDQFGVTQGAYPIALLSIPAKDQYIRDSISIALDNAASSLHRTASLEQQRELLAASLRRTRKLREKEQPELALGIQNAERADEYLQSGDLLLANQSRIPRGQHIVEVADYYAPQLASGEPATRLITIDPKLSVQENAERYFRRSQKARKSADSLRERRALLARVLAQIDEAEREASLAESDEQIGQIRDRVLPLLASDSRQLGEHGEAGKPRQPDKPVFDGHKIKRFTSPDGWEILVGENATANDYLTTKVAAPSDIWLHVRAGTSAHGVIRAQNRPDAVPQAVLVYAAELVAARSEVKHSGLISVDYALKKYVRKPRKSAPGAVVYQNEKTLSVSGIHG